MIPLPPHITAFLRERLPVERHASVHTCASYAYAFQLLFRFAAHRLGLAPSQFQVEHLDAPLILAFLADLENQRHNTASSRNIRLAAIKSFMRFLEYRVPSALDQVHQILAIPVKRTDSRLIHHLNQDEVQALLDAPDPSTRMGVRDRAMLHLAVAAGLRVSELIGIQLRDLTLQPQPSVRILGKGRRERILPLWKVTATALRAWLAVRGEWSTPELFINSRGEVLTRGGFAYILAQHVKRAAQRQPTLAERSVSPHVLRHTCAMITLQATHDIRKVALWLGHATMKTTEVYLRADPTEKLDALASIIPPNLRRGKFTPPDKLIESLRPSAAT